MVCINSVHLLLKEWLKLEMLGWLVLIGEWSTKYVFNSLSLINGDEEIDDNSLNLDKLFLDFIEAFLAILFCGIWQFSVFSLLSISFSKFSLLKDRLRDLEDFRDEKP